MKAKDDYFKGYEDGFNKAKALAPIPVKYKDYTGFNVEAFLRDYREWLYNFKTE